MFYSVQFVFQELGRGERGWLLMEKTRQMSVDYDTFKIGWRLVTCKVDVKKLFYVGMSKKIINGVMCSTSTNNIVSRNGVV